MLDWPLDLMAFLGFVLFLMGMVEGEPMVVFAGALVTIVGVAVRIALDLSEARRVERRREEV